MKLLLSTLIGLIALAWGFDVMTTDYSARMLWILRQELMYLSGVLAIGMMSLAMLLSARPGWLERPLGGLDRMYLTHKWAGILAGLFAFTHWFSKSIIGDILKATIGKEGKMHREKFEGLWGLVQGVGKEAGEWAFYILLAMILLALWRRFPYHLWRIVHRAMPAIYLALVFHALMMAPTAYWRQPLGWLLLALFAAGVYGSLTALGGHIGRGRRHAGKILALEPIAPNLLKLRCQMEADWPGHQPGQFAFLQFAGREGGHPFTIASASRADRTLDFYIKALGDYTRRLQHGLKEGQSLGVEGPYGCFQPPREQSGKRPLWVAGGIGITPFLAWLDALGADPARAPAAELHYCTHDGVGDPLVQRLHELCAALPAIRLYVYGSEQGKRLEAGALRPEPGDRRRTEVWFCGPPGLAKALRKALEETLDGEFGFHHEVFALR